MFNVVTDDRKCICLQKPKTLQIICKINSVLNCHSHMTGFLYPTPWSCAGLGHSTTLTVNGPVLKTGPLNLAADVKSKIEGY